MTGSRQSRHGSDFHLNRLCRLHGPIFVSRLTIVLSRPPVQQASDESDEAYVERLLRDRYDQRSQAARRIIAEDLERIAQLTCPE